MKLAALILGFACQFTWAQNLDYSTSGKLILTHLSSAPFPHPSRAEGHTYKDKLYPAAENYSDNTVAIFVPRGFRETGRVDFVVHFHGWNNHVANVLQHYRLIEQLVASGRNAILVVPQGPKDAPDSSGGRLEDKEGFRKFMGDVVTELRHSGALTQTNFNLGQIVLSGHSGGYRVISAILDRGGLTDRVREVWLFDALYAETDKFLAWAAQPHAGRLLNIYTDNGGTKGETEAMMATLKQRAIPFLAVSESDLKTAELRRQGCIFLHTALAHDDVVEKHETFKTFLETSELEALRGK
jgi:hypothetical protein